MATVYTRFKHFGTVKLNEPLAKHTTFKIGGPADFFVIVKENGQLIELLRLLDGEGISRLILGGGSNILISDEGFRGVVIVPEDRRFWIQDEVVEAHAGASIQEVSRATIKAGLTGFEWAIGVPGTIAGALRGNAAYNGVAMEDSIERVTVYRDGETLELDTATCRFGYKESIFKHNVDVVLSMRLGLKKGDAKIIEKEAIENITYRKETQPKGHGSAGCIFKNIVVDAKEKKRLQHILSDKRILEMMEKYGKVPVGRLIDLVGMKGARKGDAMVSDVHANFIVNMGGATAVDVLHLIEQIKERVYTTFSIRLEEEIQLVL